MRRRFKFEPLVAEFEKIAEERYVTASDGTQLRVYLTTAPPESKNGYTLFMIPGWATIVPSWDEVLLEAMKYFDIVYFESREKDSSILNKKTKNRMDRVSEDLKDVVIELELDEHKLVPLASSWGGMLLADALAKKKINPYKLQKIEEAIILKEERIGEVENALTLEENYKNPRKAKMLSNELRTLREELNTLNRAWEDCIGD